MKRHLVSVTWLAALVAAGVQVMQGADAATWTLALALLAALVVPKGGET